MKHKINISNGYMTINIDNNIFVIDTGMPLNSFTLDKPKTFTIDKNIYHFDGCPFGFNKEEINQNVGCDVTGFLSLHGPLENGFTLIKEGDDLYIDLDIKDHPDGERIDLNLYSPYLVINDVSINNSHKCSSVIIDTGAPIGYVRDDLVSNLPKGDKYEDYNFMEGHFSGYLRNVPIYLNNKRGVVKCGVFSDTPRLIRGYNQMGIDGVINITDFFSKSVTFDLLNKKLYID